MPFLSVDIGTTHCKAGMIGEDGQVISYASLPMPNLRSPKDFAYFDPEQIWAKVIEVFRIAINEQRADNIAAVGVTIMAESGLLVDKASGNSLSPMIPWFDMSSVVQVEKIKQASDPMERFCKSGIRVSYKCSLSKLLWLKENGLRIAKGMIWMSVADFIVYRLTGEIRTDYSLAGRTFAFRIDQKEWDAPWLRQWGLPTDLFPPALPGSEPAGKLVAIEFIRMGLADDIPVIVAGHDHICAAFGAGVIEPGQVFDSMGTAESLFGVIQQRELGEEEFRSGLSFGCHVVEGRMYWVGGYLLRAGRWIG